MVEVMEYLSLDAPNGHPFPSAHTRALSHSLTHSLTLKLAHTNLLWNTELASNYPKKVQEKLLNEIIQ